MDWKGLVGRGFQIGGALSGLGGLNDIRKLIQSPNAKDTDDVVEALLMHQLDQEKRIQKLEKELNKRNERDRQ